MALRYKCKSYMAGQLSTIVCCKMMQALHSLTVVAALTAVLASCPEKNAITNFNIEAFLGRWYEVLRLPSEYERHYSCMADHYHYGENGIVVDSYAFNTSKGEYDTLDGNVETAPGGIGRYVIKYGNESAWNTTYWVLGTDYTSFMAVAGCLQGGDDKPTALMWIMSRHLPLKEEHLPAIDQVLTDHSLSRDQFEAVSHEDCPPRVADESK